MTVVHRSAVKLRLLAAVLGLAPAGAAADLHGIVIGVANGDTLTLQIEERTVEMRLGDIDAPEPGQPYALRATASLAELCLLKPAVVSETGIDKPRGVFGRVVCSGVDAAAEQVRRGMAWVSSPLASGAPLQPLQDEARALRRGLWREPGQVPPWEWSAAYATGNAN